VIFLPEAYGFVHQCRQLPYQAKVLACAFSNVGADNLVEQMLRMGLHVVRVGKASSVSPKLLDFTLDSAIAKDPDAQRAMEEASRASMKLRQLTQTIGRKSIKRTAGDGMEERRIREKATLAVKASIKVRFCAQTYYLFEAQIINLFFFLEGMQYSCNEGDETSGRHSINKYWCC